MDSMRGTVEVRYLLQSVYWAHVGHISTFQSATVAPPPTTFARTVANK